LLSGILGQDTKVTSTEPIGSQPEQPRPIRHWQAKEVVVHSTPVSSVQCDGEMIGDTPKNISILAAALQVVTPPPAVQANVSP